MTRVRAPLVNILIRCTLREDYFKVCIGSVRAQTYPYWRAIVCYDDDDCLSYFAPYLGDPRIVLLKAPEVDRSHTHFYNLYCNFLLDQVTDGWIMFLDDDDRFESKKALAVIASTIRRPDDFIVWGYRLGASHRWPRDVHDIKYGEVSSASVCFHSRHSKRARWVPQRGSDFRFIRQLLDVYPGFQRTLLNSTLVGTQGKGMGNQGIRDGSCLREWIRKFRVSSVRVSESLVHLGARMREKYSLVAYDPDLHTTETVLFFGMYTSSDAQAIGKHLGPILLMPGGSDTPNVPGVLARRSATIISISRDIQRRLRETYGVAAIRAHIDLVDRSIFRTDHGHARGAKVFVYDGRAPKTKAAERIYNQKCIDAVMSALPQEDFVLSSQLDAKYEDMPKVYAECRIGLRLTEHDGNANMVQEMEAMGIPVVHNQSEYGLKWKTVEDVVHLVG